MRIRNAQKIMKVEGLKESPVQGVYLNNVVAEGQQGITIDYGKRIDFSDCHFRQSQKELYQVQHSQEIHYETKP